MFSHQARVWVQLRQWERGLTMLSPAGQRLRHTLRKLPKARPNRPANTVARMRIMRELSIRGWAGRVGGAQKQGLRDSELRDQVFRRVCYTPN
jgi:hypothetical protein